jgi:hypothetical protein
LRFIRAMAFTTLIIHCIALKVQTMTRDCL